MLCHRYSPEVSEDACVPCPAHSITDGVVGATTVSQCLCVAGYSGILTACDGNDCVGGNCLPCPANFYKQSTGLYECTACPANAVSDEASTSISMCACNTDSGYSGGPILSWCDQCVSSSVSYSCIAGAPPPVAIIYPNSNRDFCHGFSCMLGVKQWSWPRA